MYLHCVDRLKTYPKTIVLFSGMISGSIFAPIFFIPGLIMFSMLLWYIKYANTFKQALIFGFIFGFGQFLISMYWIVIGVSVYLEEFWWALPFALFGLPCILAIFIAISCSIAWFFRCYNAYQLIFCATWIFFEWLRSWLFTGLPWNLVGYAFAFSDVLAQSVNIISIYGLGFIIIYISSCFYNCFDKSTQNQLTVSLITSIILIIIMIFYGTYRLYNNPTIFSDIKIRLVQPSIPQTDKWDINQFIKHLDTHISLSIQQNNTDFQPDLIFWSEAALVLPYEHPLVKAEISNMLKTIKAILITGGVSHNNKQGEEFEIYTVLEAIDADRMIFEYYKSHLVPFGEYIPLRTILPIKKLTPGFIDYTEGKSKTVYLKQFGLTIKALICYESIFPHEVRTANANVIINATNDAWYGRSSGPYQHFYISKMRSVENGIPMIRIANNGISAIIDSYGRVINQTTLNAVTIIDGLMPNDQANPTMYSLYGNIMALLALLLVVMIKVMINLFIQAINKYIIRS